MVSKMVTDRQKLAAAMAAAIGTHGERAAQQLTALLSPYLEEGETAPDLALFQALLRRRVTELRRTMVSADEAHRDEQDDDVTARSRRDEAAAILVGRLVQVRTLVDGAYGKGTCASLLGIEGTLSRDPVVLHRLTERVMNRIRAKDFATPAPTLPGVALEPASWLETLQQPFDELEQAMIQLFDENRELEGSQVAKNQAIADYDRAYLLTARFLEFLFLYVGLDDLSHRLRRTRRGTSADDPEESEDTEDEADEAQLDAQTAVASGLPQPAS